MPNYALWFAIFSFGVFVGGFIAMALGDRDKKK